MEHSSHAPWKELQKNAREERAAKAARRSPRYRYGVRADSHSVTLRTFWGMHLERMN